MATSRQQSFDWEVISHPTGEAVMDILQDRYLRQAERESRFSPQKSELHLITVQKGYPNYRSYPATGDISAGLASAFERNAPTPTRTAEGRLLDESALKCVLQRSRPQHISGRPDCLPFRDAKEARKVFTDLNLPSSYFQIADGFTGSAQSRTVRDQLGNVVRYEMIAHCISKQGDWAIALSHSALVKQTSVFWSVDTRIDSETLLTDLREFQHCASHPMLVPCIMFAGNLRANEHRRQSIKERIQLLEDAVRRFGAQTSFVTDLELRALDGQRQPKELESLFDMLHSCRKDQTSRKGRYEFWRMCHEAIEEGFQYVKATFGGHTDQQLLKVHEELGHWKAVVYSKFESLLARDKDHINRVETVSNMLYSIVHQRDIRLQSYIARAAQRDSEDVKFLTVLGSVFLPASLIATILNVPDFQFTTGGALFGAYIGITVPFSAIVVLLCFTRVHLKQWLSLVAVRGKRPKATAQWASSSLS